MGFCFFFLFTFFFLFFFAYKQAFLLELRLASETFAIKEAFRYLGYISTNRHATGIINSKKNTIICIL